MKYHYKSPEELKDEARRESEKSSAKKNRGHLIIFADLFVIFLIFAGIYYTGALRPDRYVSEGVVIHDALEFSGSVELPENSGGEHVFYLNVKHAGSEAREFPDPDSGFPRARIEILEGRPGPAIVKFSGEFPLTPRVLRPGETTIYRAELRVPDQTNFRKGDARIQLEFADQKTTSVVL